MKEVLTKKELNYLANVKRKSVDVENAKKKQIVNSPLFEMETYLKNAKRAAKYGDYDAKFEEIDFKEVKDNMRYIQLAAKHLEGAISKLKNK